MSATIDLKDLRHLYCALMEEIKQRGDIINNTLEGHNPYPAWAALEMCYLQLRMMCECIALGCVAAHGDIAVAKGGRITKTVAADWILNNLERLHPEFYPIPKNAVATAVPQRFRLEPVTEEFLTKSDLLDLYHECGGILHRGTLRTIRRKFLPPDFSPVLTYYTKIIRLLSEHNIQLSDRTQHFFVVMRSGSDDKVRAWLMRDRDTVV